MSFPQTFSTTPPLNRHFFPEPITPPTQHRTVQITTERGPNCTRLKVSLIVLGSLLIIGGATEEAICNEADYSCKKYALIGKIAWITGASIMGFAICCLGQAYVTTTHQETSVV
ncbi:MAG: hypothetical protein ACI9S8_001493 [Chlamydiales bacterium]|jgi:hypothetical protein